MRLARLFLVIGVTLAAGHVITAGQEPQSDSKGSEGAKTPEGFVLKTAETIEFTTDEVTWMSVDVSPDGRTILFDLLGDLYTLPIDGGDGHAHHGRAVVREPADVVARRQDDRVSERSHRRREPVDRRRRRLEPARGQQGQKTNDRPQIMVSPAWTPDGQYIVVSKSRPPDPGTFWLFMYHRDGGTGVRVGARAAAAARARRAGPAAAAADRTAWARSSRPTAASSTTRSATAPSPTTRSSRCGRSIATIARPATSSQVTNAQRQRDASGDLARRQVAGLRHAPQDADRPARPQSRDRRRALARSIRSRATIRSRAPAATRCRATTSCPTASR